MLDKVVKNLVLEVAVKAAIKRLFIAIPWLGIPVVSQIVSYFAMKLAEFLYDEMALAISFAIIDIKVDLQADAYKAASQELKNAVDSQDEVKINEAKQKFKNSLRDLIQFPH